MEVSWSRGRCIGTDVVLEKFIIRPTASAKSCRIVL